MRRATKITGWVAAGVTFAPLALAALLASIAVLPYGGGASRPFLTWPLKLLAFLVAIGAAAVVGAFAALVAEIIARLFGRAKAP